MSVIFTRRGAAPGSTTEPVEYFTVKIVGKDERSNTTGALGYATVGIDDVVYNCSNNTTLTVAKGTTIKCRTSYVYNSGQTCFPYIYYNGTVVSGSMNTNGTYDFELDSNCTITITLSETSYQTQYYGVIKIVTS